MTSSPLTTGGIWAGSGLRFSGFGHYFPRTRRGLEQEITLGGRTHPPEVAERLGIRALHVADEDETIEQMSSEATKMALADASVAPHEIDLLVLTNWTDRVYIPETGPSIAAAVGAPHALAFDVCTACAGFVHATQIVAALLAARPDWTHGVVVAADHAARHARPGTKGQLVFGDGAGAAVLSKEPGRTGLRDSVLDSDPSRTDLVTVKGPDGWIYPAPELIEAAVEFNGVTAETLLKRNDVSLEDVDWVVSHPGNGAIIEGVRRYLGDHAGKLLTNYPDRGNTNASSIPTTMSEYKKAGILKEGDLVLSTVVGTGWYYGGILFQL